MLSPKIWSKRLRTRRGFTLLEVLMAAGIAGGIAMVLSSMFTTGLKVNRKISGQLDRTAIIQSIQSNLDCKNTISHMTVPSAAVCEANLPLMDLYDHSNSLMVSSNNATPTVIGEWTLRAVCRYSATMTTVRGIAVEMAKPKPGVPNPLNVSDPTQFLTDPLQTSKPFSWSMTIAGSQKYTDALLYKVGTFPCVAELTAAWATPATPPTLPCNPNAAHCDTNLGKFEFRAGPMMRTTVPAGKDCNPSLASDMHPIFPHGNKPILWGATALCPAGTIAIGGGATCSGPSSTAGICGGVLLSSDSVVDPVSKTPYGWWAFCCKTTNCSGTSTVIDPATNTATPAVDGAVWVTCVSPTQ